MELLLYFITAFLQPIVIFTPEALTIVAGVGFFGPLYAFIFGSLGIFLGGCTLYFLAYHGLDKFFKKVKTNKKFLKLTNEINDINIIFLVCLFIFPVLPDNFVCLAAGVVKLKPVKYVFAFFTAKVITTYSYAYGIDFLSKVHPVYWAIILVSFVLLYVFIKKMSNKIIK